MECLSFKAVTSETISIKRLFDLIHELRVDIDELKRIKSRLSQNKEYSSSISISIDEQINQILNRIIELEELEIEEIPNPLRPEFSFTDHVSVTKIREIESAKVNIDNNWEKQVHQYIQSMQKTEIHLHMEACISAETLLLILEENEIAHDPDEVRRRYKFQNLQEFINLFLYILDAIKSSEDFKIIYAGLIKYLEANNIIYAEVFIAPSRLIQNGLHFNEVIETIEELMRETRLLGGPEINLIIDLSRTFGTKNADNMLTRVIESKSNAIIGVGLGGVELIGPARDFQDTFARARAEGLHCVVHAGEDDGPWSIRDAIELLGAERIGHATSMIQDPKLMELVKKRKIPIEVCLTSNIFTGKYVRKEVDHPVRRYYDEGITCTINTDDPKIFNVELNEEYFKYFKYLNFTPAELIDLDKQGVYATFSNNKDVLWRKIEKNMQPLQNLLMHHP